ncbi:hypothetical protein ACWC5I_28670, partial [Kitasatospora sp. NPDC001574]
RPGYGGGGLATVPAPVYAPPAEVHHHYHYPAAPAPAAVAPVQAGARFSVGRLRPVANGLALAVGVVVTRTVWNPVFHVFGDEIGVPMAGLAAALVLEYRYLYQRAWPVRVFTFSMLSALVISPAGLHLGGYWLTGV